MIIRLGLVIDSTESRWGSSGKYSWTYILPERYRLIQHCVTEGHYAFAIYVTWDAASDDETMKVCCSANRSRMAKHGDSLKCVSRFAFYVSHFAFHVPETKNAFQPSFCFPHPSTMLHSLYLKYGEPKRPANNRNQRAVPEKPTRGRALGRSMYTGESLTLVVTVTAYIL